MSFVGKSLPQISKLLFSLIQPLLLIQHYQVHEVPIVKFVLEETKTLGILSNTSDVGQIANIGVTSVQPSSTTPLVDEDSYIMFGDDPEPLFNFVFHPFCECK